MLFNSVAFALFFPAVLAVEMLLHRRSNWRKPFLLFASYFFYACWDWRFLGLIWFSTSIDWFVGRGLAASDNPKHRRRLLLCSLTANLGCLGVFKYLNFFIQSANELLESFGAETPVPLLDLIIPVGISFYTFQTLSYTVDIYKNKLKPAEEFVDFALFVAFFPQLVAGPIVRARDFLPQLKNNIRPTANGFSQGLFDIMAGLFKKVVIADYLGRHLVDPVHADPQQFGTWAAVAAIYGYAFQIYGDFAGYSQIAIGAGRMLGFRLPLNFRTPYLARDMSDFWQRWHISLSSWLRDYLYIPLGGNRSGVWGTYRNLMITMLLGGLWHGAGWNFVIWGFIHGCALMVSHHRREKRRHLGIQRSENPLAVCWQCLAVFHVWALSMVFFRAQTFAEAIQVFASLGRWSGSEPELLGVWMLVLAIVLHIASPTWKPRIQKMYLRLAPELQGALLILLLGLLAAMSSAETPFIYFQF